MKSIVLSLMLTATLAMMPRTGAAITLPDYHSPCNYNGLCLQIVNTWSNGADNPMAMEVASKGTVMLVRANGSGSEAIGVRAITSSGTGLKGESASGTAVVGQSSSSSGVYGSSYSGEGVYAYGTAGHATTALWADAQNDGVVTWAGIFVGDVSANGYYTNSDARLKKNVADMSYGLPQLLKLRPVTYQWRQAAGADRTQLGLIAQEVQRVIPEVIRPDRTGTLAVNYTHLLPVVIKAMQEQQKIIERQEARIAALERQGGTLKASMLPDDLRLVVVLVALGAFAAIASRKRKASAA